MTLSEYLKINELTATEFAARIDRSVSTVTRAAKGEAIPDVGTMAAIVRGTNGSVQPNSFYTGRGIA